MSRWLVTALSALVLAACATTPAETATTQPSGPAPDGRTQTQPLAYPVSNDFTPQTYLNVCPGMIATNVPARDANGKLVDYSPFIRVDGVVVAVAPVNGACLSSGFGVRGTSLHKGIDLFSRESIPIHAGGNGKVIESGYRDDYGNYVVIDHGGGVFTRYAHLASRERAAGKGKDIAFGTLLGLMGNTASYPIPIHLHYEVLTGDYNTPKKSFGLDAVDPFSAVWVPVE